MKFDCIRAKLSLTLFNADSSIDALVFGNLAEKTLGLTAAECFAQRKQETCDHLLITYGMFAGKVRIYNVKKNRVMRRGTEEYQYVVTSCEDREPSSMKVQPPSMLNNNIGIQENAATSSCQPVNGTIQASSNSASGASDT